MEKIFELLMNNPEVIVPMVKGYIDKYKPAVYGVLEELHNILKDYANNKEYFKTIAIARKNYFDAHVEVGFTEDQALAIMLNHNLELMENIEKASTEAKISNQNNN